SSAARSGSATSPSAPRRLLRRFRTVSASARCELSAALNSVHGNNVAPEPEVGALVPAGGWVHTSAISAKIASSAGVGRTGIGIGGRRSAHLLPASAATSALPLWR